MDSIYENKILDVMKKAKIEYGANSILEEIKFTDDKGKPVEYTVDLMYRIGKPFLFGIISRVDNGKQFLVDIESIKKMTVYGYINNTVVTVDNAIKPHKNKIIDIKRIKEYDKISISINDSNIVTKLRQLGDTYGYIIKVDDTNIKPISWLRLVPYGAVFDLGGNVCAVQVRDELGYEELMSIDKFLKISSADYNIGKWSPRSEARNFYRALKYAEVNTEVYLKLREILGENSTKLFVEHECGDYYRCDMDKLKVEMARIIFADIDEEKQELLKTNVFYAIPRPEKFETKKLFESALREAKHIESTKFSLDKYELVEVDGLDRDAVFNLLLSRYSELHAGSYLKTYKDIVEYAVKALNKELVKIESEIKDRVLLIINEYNKGTDVTDMIEQLGFKVANESYDFKDNTHKEYVHTKLISHRANQDDLKKYMRTATLEELAEHFELSHLIKKEKTRDTIEEQLFETEDVIEEMCDDLMFISGIEDDSSTYETNIIDSINLTEDSINRLEIRVEQNSRVCVYLVLGDDTIRIDDSEQVHIDYIKHGVDRRSIEKPLIRTLKLIKTNLNIEDILDKLG